MAQSTLDILPVTPIIGAEVEGIDLREPLEQGVVAELKQAINRWKVLFFHDQDISTDQFLTFGRYFGQLTPAHPIAAGLPEHPEIWQRAVDEYRNRKKQKVESIPTGVPLRDSKGWHIDITFVANPNKYSILHGIEIPPYGGDTVWASTAAAYEGLSPAIKAFVDGLQAVHATGIDEYAYPKPNAAPMYASVHPLVRIHPNTGEKTLFLNPDAIRRIVGLKASESRAIIDLLFDELTRPEYQIRFRWTPRTIAMWDNQATAHAGPIDYAQFDLPRVVRRIMVAGDITEGPDGFRSRPLEGELFESI